MVEIKAHMFLDQHQLSYIIHTGATFSIRDHLTSLVRFSLEVAFWWNSNIEEGRVYKFRPEPEILGGFSIYYLSIWYNPKHFLTTLFQEDNSGVWKLTLAIAIHAVPIVFCVGTDLISAGMKKLKIVIYIIVLSLNTPIGIFIGIMIFDNSDEESGEHILINGILQADWDSRLVKKSTT